MKRAYMDINVLLWSRHVKFLVQSVFRKLLTVWMPVFPICPFPMPKDNLVQNITLWMRLRGINSLSNNLTYSSEGFDWNNDIVEWCKRGILKFVKNFDEGMRTERNAHSMVVLWHRLGVHAKLAYNDEIAAMNTVPAWPVRQKISQFCEEPKYVKITRPHCPKLMKFMNELPK